MKLLAIDTATEYCSAAIWRDGAVVSREATGVQSASALILQMVEELLAETGMTLNNLDAIAFGRGPGGFTGVRLATSVTQGLAFAADRPVLPVSDLRAVAQRAFVQHPDIARLLVCQDARMGETYTAAFARVNGFATLVGVEAVCKPAQVQLPAGWSAEGLPGAGSAFAVFPELSRLATTLADCHPHAAVIAALAAHDGLAAAVSAEQAQPVYLRNDVAVPG